MLNPTIVESLRQRLDYAKAFTASSAERSVVIEAETLEALIEVWEDSILEGSELIADFERLQNEVTDLGLTLSEAQADTEEYRAQVKHLSARLEAVRKLAEDK